MFLQDRKKGGWSFDKCDRNTELVKMMQPISTKDESYRINRFHIRKINYHLSLIEKNSPLSSLLKHFTKTLIHTPKYSNDDGMR